MKKITSFKNANELVKKMLENSELRIQLWDEVDSNRIMSLEKDEEFELWCFITLEDTVNGTVKKYHAYVSEAEEAIWHNRKNVNKLNDLASI